MLSFLYLANTLVSCNPNLNFPKTLTGSSLLALTLSLAVTDTKLDIADLDFLRSHSLPAGLKRLTLLLDPFPVLQYLVHRQVDLLEPFLLRDPVKNLQRTRAIVFSYQPNEERDEADCLKRREVNQRRFSLSLSSASRIFSNWFRKDALCPVTACTSVPIC